MLQDALFFAPKAYDGTPRGQKKGKYMKKSGEIRCFSGFSFLYFFSLILNFSSWSYFIYALVTLSTVCKDTDIVSFFVIKEVKFLKKSLKTYIYPLTI